MPLLPPADLSEPGWSVRTGQAVWKPANGRPEIAGRMLLATRDGQHGAEDVIRFSKDPMDVVLARRSDQGWSLQIPAFNKSFSGRGRPPRRISWFQLAEAAFRGALSTPWEWNQVSSNRWVLANTATGERIEGYFAP